MYADRDPPIRIPRAVGLPRVPPSCATGTPGRRRPIRERVPRARRSDLGGRRLDCASRRYAGRLECGSRVPRATVPQRSVRRSPKRRARSEEHTSELQSRQYLVCRLLLEKKKKKMKTPHNTKKKKKNTQ